MIKEDVMLKRFYQQNLDYIGIEKLLPWSKEILDKIKAPANC